MNLYNTVCPDLSSVSCSAIINTAGARRVWRKCVPWASGCESVCYLCLWESISATQTHLLCVSACIDSAGQLFSRHQFSRILIRIKNVKWKLKCEGPADCRDSAASLKCAKVRLQTTALNTSAERRTKQSRHDPFGWCLCRTEMRTTLAPMLVCPLPSQGMDAETGICGGAKGTELAWAMFVWEDRWSVSSELKNQTQQQTVTENVSHHWGRTEAKSSNRSGSVLYTFVAYPAT